jgi:hypothetical protein
MPFAIHPRAEIYVSLSARTRRAIFSVSTTQGKAYQIQKLTRYLIGFTGANILVKRQVQASVSLFQKGSLSCMVGEQQLKVMNIQGPPLK